MIFRIYTLGLLLLPLYVLASCIENQYDVPMNYWYYHSGDNGKCMEKFIIRPFDSICNVENNRNFHFINISNEDWLYYDYADKTGDKLIFNRKGLFVNNSLKINGKKTSGSLKRNKDIQFCNEPVITLDYKSCSLISNKNIQLKKQIALSVMQYLFLRYDKNNQNYKEILINSKEVYLTLETINLEKQQDSISYRFGDFQECGKFISVELISYSAPKASSKKVFILKFDNNKLEIIKEELIWIS